MNSEYMYHDFRDSIRNEINGSSDMQKQIRSNGDSIAGVNVRLRQVFILDRLKITLSRYEFDDSAVSRQCYF